MLDYKLHQQICAAEAKSLIPPKEIDYCEDCNRDIDDCKCSLCSCGMKIESLDPDKECDCEESDKRRAKRLRYIEPYKQDKEDD